MNFLLNIHCMKSIQIQSFFWSLFSANAGKLGPEKTPYFDTFHAVIIIYFIRVMIIKITIFKFFFLLFY